MPVVGQTRSPLGVTVGADGPGGQDGASPIPCWLRPRQLSWRRRGPRLGARQTPGYSTAGNRGPALSRQARVDSRVRRIETRTLLKGYLVGCAQGSLLAGSREASCGADSLDRESWAESSCPASRHSGQAQISMVPWASRCAAECVVAAVQNETWRPYRRDTSDFAAGQSDRTGSLGPAPDRHR
jgi:hypothetical protein